MTYSRKLANPQWQKKRLEIFKRDKWKCRLCGDKETELHVHHLKYSGKPQDEPNENLITLCAHCHYEVEALTKHFSDKDWPLLFDSVKIIKIDWTDRSRMMVARYLNSATLRVYDENNNLLVGYIFNGEKLNKLIKFLK